MNLTENFNKVGKRISLKEDNSAELRAKIRELNNKLEDQRQQGLKDIQRIIPSSCYVQSLSDPVQNFGVYGLLADNKEQIENTKKKLKAMGASKFRTVKNKRGFVILCLYYVPKN